MVHLQLEFTGELVDLFREAYDLVKPHLAQILEPEDYYECLEKAGHMKRIDEINHTACELLKTGSDTGLYAFWVKYAHAPPAEVFNT